MNGFLILEHLLYDFFLSIKYLQKREVMSVKKRFSFFLLASVLDALNIN